MGPKGPHCMTTLTLCSARKSSRFCELNCASYGRHFRVKFSLKPHMRGLCRANPGVPMPNRLSASGSTSSLRANVFIRPRSKAVAAQSRSGIRRLPKLICSATTDRPTPSVANANTFFPGMGRAGRRRDAHLVRRQLADGAHTARTAIMVELGTLSAAKARRLGRPNIDLT